jgi:exodeoxyribonuclease III
MKHVGLPSYFVAEQADYVLLQEVKTPYDEQLDEELQSLYPYRYYHCKKKGYAGVGLWTKTEPTEVILGWGDLITRSEEDEGRILTIVTKQLVLINTYMPNASAGLKRLPYKHQWMMDFIEMVKQLQAVHPTKLIVIGGDLNVCMTEQDLSRPKENYNKTAGYTQAEIDDMQALMDQCELVDAYRHTNPETRAYSYFSKRFQCRQKSLGWRLDSFLVRDSDMISDCLIRDEIYGPSDHCPMVLTLKHQE